MSSKNWLKQGVVVSRARPFTDLWWGKGSRQTQYIELFHVIFDFECNLTDFWAQSGSVVLSSFVEHNLHKDLNSLVPLFLLNCQSLQILMYDCKTDVLLISDKFFFRDNIEVNKGFILLLFIFINHRYVVKCKLAVYRLNMFKLIMHIST